MLLAFEERPSDSPFVERIWRSQSERAGAFISVANTSWEMVVTRYQGKMTLTVRGPETRASEAVCAADGEWIAVRFKLGTLMPHLPPKKVMDRQDVTLPQAGSKTFWLHGSTWQFPTYENAETFIARLTREGLVVREPVVNGALRGQANDLSLRSVQRRFTQTTGLTLGEVRQIERARYATSLLRQGVPILDTVYQAGYFDQPHLTRSLKHFIGQTPTQIVRETEQLSFLYKTEAPLMDYDTNVPFNAEGVFA